MSSCYDARLTTCCCSGVVLGDGIRTLHKERLSETDLVHTQRGTSQAAVVNLHSCCLIAVRWRGIAICSRAENYVKTHVVYKLRTPEFLLSGHVVGRLSTILGTRVNLQKEVTGEHRSQLRVNVPRRRLRFNF